MFVYFYFYSKSFVMWSTFKHTWGIHKRSQRGCIFSLHCQDYGFQNASALECWSLLYSIWGRGYVFWLHEYFQHSGGIHKNPCKMPAWFLQQHPGASAHSSSPHGQKRVPMHFDPSSVTRFPINPHGYKSCLTSKFDKHHTCSKKSIGDRFYQLEMHTGYLETTIAG